MVDKMTEVRVAHFPSGIFHRVEVDRVSIPQEKLNLSKKTRNNPLPWNGQFSPQLVEELIKYFASSKSFVLDPFLGSGTVLYEAIRSGHLALGMDINPASVYLSRIYLLANLPTKERQKVLYDVELFVKEVALFPQLVEGSSRIYQRIVQKVESSSLPQRFLLLALGTLLPGPNESAPKVIDKLQKIWFGKIKPLVESLPYTQNQLWVCQGDARKIPLEPSTVDLVITSPPYINVHNYHQQHRASVEALCGTSLLGVARAEIGSNRRNRQNRFLTVVQYAIDMAMVLCEIKRVLKAAGKVIVIIGRESTVEGVAVNNSELVAEIAHEIVELDLLRRYERFFVNKYGRKIYEDILVFQPKSTKCQQLRGTNQEMGAILNEARNLGRKVLESLKTAVEDERTLAKIETAVTRSDAIIPSPLLESCTCSGANVTLEVKNSCSLFTDFTFTNPTFRTLTLD